MIYDTPNSVKNTVGLGSFDFAKPSTYIPTITQDDYDRGYIDRFFVARINYFDIIETNYKDYNVANTSYFIKTKIDWKITGPEFNTYIGKTLQETGVVNYNNFRIRDAQLYIKNINIILNNPKQFWRGF
jgi:hypothetical protein